MLQTIRNPSGNNAVPAILATLLVAAAGVLRGISLRAERGLPPDRLLRHTPPCPFHQLTGLLCPGCGATRALLALLHAHPRAALHFNPLLVALLPLAAAYLLLAISRRRLPNVPTSAIATLLGVAILFGIARNLPGLQ